MLGLVKALIPVATKWLSNDAKEDANRTRVDLAVVEGTGHIARILALTYLFAPDIAPLLPWVEIADVISYKQGVQEAIPEWEEMAKKAAIFGMWGASHRQVGRVKKARALKREAEVRGVHPRDLP